MLLAIVAAAACETSSQPLAGQSAGRELGTVDEKGLSEISGMVVSRRNPGVLWVHGDGGIQRVVAVNVLGRRVVRVELDEKAVDCEDVALGPGPGGGDYLYLGDIGDNDRQRDSIRVIRFAEPVFTPATPARLAAQNVEQLDLAYPDGRHDAEALLVDPGSGDMFIVTKEKSTARLYRAPAASWTSTGPVRLERMGRIPVSKVSAGDISRDGRSILLRREEVGWLWKREGTQSIADAMRGAPQRVVVLRPTQDENGEAIAFHPEGQGYYTISEGKRQPIYHFPLP